MTELRKLQNTDEDNLRLSVIQIGYPEVVAITTEYIIVKDDDNIFSLVSIVDGEVVKASKAICTSFVPDEGDTNLLVITSVINQKYITIIKIDDELYCLDRLLISCNTKFGVSIVMLFPDTNSDNLYTSVILIRNRDKKILLCTDIKEAPLEAAASEAKIQFLTPNNEVYGINKLGSLMYMKGSTWTAIDGPSVYDEFDD